MKIIAHLLLVLIFDIRIMKQNENVTWLLHQSELIALAQIHLMQYALNHSVTIHSIILGMDLQVSVQIWLDHGINYLIAIIRLIRDDDHIVTPIW